MNRKTILLAHGSRDPNWVKNFENILSSISQELNSTDFGLAYLEHTGPSIEESVKKAQADAYTDLVFLPLFMAAGAHLRNDVPKILEDLEKKYPGMKLTLLRPIGEDPAIAQAITQILRENLKEASEISLMN